MDSVLSGAFFLVAAKTTRQWGRMGKATSEVPGPFRVATGRDPEGQLVVVFYAFGQTFQRP